ncbi:MAG: hypothetical protein HN732_14860 [Rhodospirillaceae bacterium]|jgi:hypothetical protein|nr:hypothetical protein [Rhodospirillaceae bacterium]
MKAPAGIEITRGIASSPHVIAGANKIMIAKTLMNFQRMDTPDYFVAVGLIETLGSQAFRKSDHQRIDPVGQLIETDGNHLFRLHH